MLPDGEDPSSSKNRKAPVNGSYEPTNTYALLLPHRSLFSPEILDHLFAFYSKFGCIDHWAPVQGLGRIIIVWSSDDCGHIARISGGGSLTICGDGPERAAGIMHQKTSLTIRLLPLPSTPRSTLDRLRSRANVYDANNPDPHCLAAPEQPRNFLISPPGSPPEGWEPIVEDAPNTLTLASDLISALSSIELNLDGKSPFTKRWIGVDVTTSSTGDVDVEVHDQEVILQTESGMKVSVFAPAEDNAVSGSRSSDTEQSEYIKYLPDNTPDATLMNENCVPAGWRTPGVGEKTFSKRPLPTARPPLAPHEN